MIYTVYREHTCGDTYNNLEACEDFIAHMQQGDGESVTYRIGLDFAGRFVVYRRHRIVDDNTGEFIVGDFAHCSDCIDRQRGLRGSFLIYTFNG